MRIEGDFIKINEWLRPLSWLYGLGVGFRNMLFEIGVLKSRAYDIPVIAVGNITVAALARHRMLSISSICCTTSSRWLC